MSALPHSIGKYRVTRELGVGGMGTVYAVQDPLLPRELALKTVRTDLADERLLERFAREAEAMARVKHESIVGIHEVGRWERGMYLTLDLVEGKTISDRVELEGSLGARDAAQLVIALSLAVEAIHAAGILHRDLKPANVILRPDGSPVLLDFGLVRDDSLERLTVTGEILGTPTYMSPEQANATTSPTEAVDVYGLGGILYFCLTAREPFSATSLTGLLSAILEGKLRPPRALRSDIPPAIEAICLRAMATEIADRYTQVRELREDLERFLAGERPQAQGTRVAGVLAIVGGLAVVAVLATGWSYARKPAAAPSQTARAPLELDEFEATRTKPFLTLSGVSNPGARIGVGRRSVEADVDGRFSLRVRLKKGQQRLVVRVFDAQDEALGEVLGEVTRSVRYLPTPMWFHKFTPRPALPLPKGVEFAEPVGEYLHVRTGIALVWVPPATFEMGRPQEDILQTTGGGDDQHRVRITRGYFIGKYEVTWKQYELYCKHTSTKAPPRHLQYAVKVNLVDPGQDKLAKGEGAPFDPSDQHPVHGLSWADAATFCAWAELRLPSEAEWELAARGTDARRFPWGSEEAGPRLLNIHIDGDGYAYTNPVGKYPQGASPYGCLDMAGNVAEAVQDWLAPYAGSGEVVVDPTGPDTPTGRRAARGGSWSCSHEQSARAYHRGGVDPVLGNVDLGLRVALSAETKK